MTSYLQETLAPGETIVHQTRLSWWASASWIAAAVLLALLTFGLGLLLLLPAWLKVHSTELAVTTRRILLKTGFLSRNTVEINLSRIEAIQIHQTFFGRLFDYGTVVVSGAGNPQAPMRDIRCPLAFRKAALAAQQDLSERGSVRSSLATV